ncbi:MAG: Fatty acyl-CoA reductase [Candidatus Izimaplasma bacterium HR2]|nr:MAG: Fatty acyl-CoA reductase [Candidatus Izimaplasma bacterium HR2]
MKKDTWTINDIEDLTGKVILVTGANSGIGYEATKVFASKGASIIMGCRNLVKAKKAKELILSEFPNALLNIIHLDLTSFKSIKEFSDKVLEKYDRLDILLNNAGIMTVPYGKTEDGLELQIGVNHFGHYYLTMSLVNLINKTKDSRIVNIASIAHYYGNINKNTFEYGENKKYNKSRAYAQSKLANLLFSYKLIEKLKKQNSNIKVLIAHPGVSSTNLGHHIKGGFVKVLQSVLSIVKQNQEKGALPGIRACTDVNVKNGEYYGPNRLFQFKGNPVVVKSNKRSHSKELQNMLWTESVRITRLDLHL